MEILTITVADTLRVIGTNTCFPDTMICKVISSQENTCSNINWTWVIIVGIIALTIIISLLIYKALKNDSIKAEREKLEKQHQWEIKAEDKRRYYKYQDQLVQLKEEKAIKIQLLETLTTEINEKL